MAQMLLVPESDGLSLFEKVRETSLSFLKLSMEELQVSCSFIIF